MKDNSKDTRTQVRDTMDLLCLKLGKEANRMRGDDTLTTRLEVVKVVTGYLSMANREPEGREGEELDQWRAQLGSGNSVGGTDAGGTGDPSDGDNHDPATGDAADEADGISADGSGLPAAAAE